MLVDHISVGIVLLDCLSVQLLASTCDLVNNDCIRLILIIHLFMDAVSLNRRQTAKPALENRFLRLSSLDHLLVLGNLCIFLIKCFFANSTTIFKQAFRKPMILSFDTFVFLASSHNIK